MSNTSDNILLENVLKGYDQLRLLRRQIGEGKLAPDIIQRLRRESRKKINEISNELKGQTAAGPLFELFNRYSLDKYQIVLVLALLRQKLNTEDPHLTGRDLIRFLFDSSFDMLRGLSYIDESSVLFSAGIIVPEAETGPGHDLLAARFRLADRVYSLITSLFICRNGLTCSETEARQKEYKSNLDYLIDLRKLSILYRKRATKVFNYDYWDEIGMGVSDSVTLINKQIQTLRETMGARIRNTTIGMKLHTLTFQESYHLREEEMIMLITLLFQELTEGNAYINAVDMVKLISKNEKDLIRNRRFFSKKDTLTRSNLIVLEDTVNGKDLTGEVFMPNWAVELMVTGKTGKEQGFDSDARLDFHNYLKNIDSSDDFFEELEE